jgi:predicted NBD/HSP70 family sugar kinase
MRVGIDLGGTKIEAIAIDDDGAEILRKRARTPAEDYEAILRAMAAMVAEVEREAGPAASIGCGTPGALSPTTGLLRNSNTVCMNGRPLKQDLERVLGRTVRLANDANCFALSEAVDGAAAGASVVFGVIIGTGVGGGVVVDQSALLGPNAIAGEWGHNPLPRMTDDERPGPACYCGRHGCIETFLSGPGLSADHARETGTNLRSHEIVARAEVGDTQADATLRRYEERMARALSSVINLVDPDVIVLGGGLSNIERLYTNVPRLWHHHVFSDHVSTRLLKNLHGDSGGVRGAAWLWPKNE